MCQVLHHSQRLLTLNPLSQASSMYVAATDLLTSLGREDAMAAPKASQGGVYELQHYSLAGSVSARAVYDALGARCGAARGELQGCASASRLAQQSSCASS